jgi:hypothetical protein
VSGTGHPGIAAFRAQFWRLQKGDVLRLMSPPGLLFGLVLGAAFCTLAGRAEAQEYCVACTGPPAVYRCIIEGARPGGSQPLQMLCITAMAKEGGHATCSVKGGTVFDCTGPAKRVPWAAYNAAPQKDPGPEPKAATPQPPAQDPNQPPQTVEEMAKRANQNTAEQIKKANEGMKEQAESFGQKVGDTTKKTWRCIASLFTQCTQ